MKRCMLCVLAMAIGAALATDARAQYRHHRTPTRGGNPYAYQQQVMKYQQQEMRYQEALARERQAILKAFQGEQMLQRKAVSRRSQRAELAIKQIQAQAQSRAYRDETKAAVPPKAKAKAGPAEELAPEPLHAQAGPTRAKGTAPAPGSLVSVRSQK